MDLGASTVWWLTAGLLVAAELATGTFYLLMLALGAVVAALAAHAGLGSNAQQVLAAVVGGGSVALWHLYQRRKPAAPPASANRDINLDIGSSVKVEQWHPDGTARVSYRGAGWDARYVGAGSPLPGEHVVRAVEGNRLMLDRANP